MYLGVMKLEAGMTYAGIGSRETPEDICLLMTNIAKRLEQTGLILRSGGADGADKAFAEGVTEHANKQIFLPWVGFNNALGTYLGSSMEEAEKIAKKFHPRWHKCSQGAKKLLTRNTFQILGADLKSPSDLVICWTKDGKNSGGTGQALRIADHYKIPVFNLHNPDNIKKIAKALQK